MTKVIKVNCTHLQYGLIIIIYLAATGGCIFGIYVQEVTLSSFTNSGDCHIGYFDGKKYCSSSITLLQAQEGIMYQTPDSVTENMYGFIGFLIAIQVITFVLMNVWKGWLKIECIAKPEQKTKSEAGSS